MILGLWNRRFKPPDNDVAADRYADTLLKETREEIVRADGKASILFASAGLVAGVVLAGIVNGEWTPDELSGTVAPVLWWLGAVTGIAAIVLLGFAVYPRLWRAEDTEEVTYFAQIAAHKSERDLDEAIRRAANRGRARTVSQLWVLSRIVRGKYRLIRWSLRGLGSALALWLLAAAASALRVCLC